MLKARGHCIAYFLPRQEKKNVKFNNMMPNLFNYKTGSVQNVNCDLYQFCTSSPPPKFIQCLDLM